MEDADMEVENIMEGEMPAELLHFNPHATTSNFFIATAEFPDMADMEPNKYFQCAVQNHANFNWRIGIYLNGNQFSYGLECLKNHHEWTIETHTDGLVFPSQFHSTVESRKHSFDHEPFWGHANWNDLRSKLLQDGTLKIQFHVTILRIFDPRTPLTGDPLVFIVCPTTNESVSCSKEFLSTQSTHFKELIEKNPNQRVINLDECIYFDDFFELILVGQGESDITDNNVNDILYVSHFFNFETILQNCEQFLINSSTFTKQKKLDISLDFNMEALKAHLNTFENSEKCVIAKAGLSCFVCHDIYKGIPLVLNCGHSLCTPCFDSLVEMNPLTTGILLCPKCRSPGIAEAAAKNFAIMSILETIDEQSRAVENTEQETTMAVANKHLRSSLVASEKTVDVMKIKMKSDELLAKEKDEEWAVQREEYENKIKSITSSCTSNRTRFEVTDKLKGELKMECEVLKIELALCKKEMVDIKRAKTQFEKQCERVESKLGRMASLEVEKTEIEARCKGLKEKLKKLTDNRGVEIIQKKNLQKDYDNLKKELTQMTDIRKAKKNLQKEYAGLKKQLAQLKQEAANNYQMSMYLGYFILTCVCVIFVWFMRQMF